MVGDLGETLSDPSRAEKRIQNGPQQGSATVPRMLDEDSLLGVVEGTGIVHLQSGLVESGFKVL